MHNCCDCYIVNVLYSSAELAHSLPIVAKHAGNWHIRTQNVTMKSPSHASHNNKAVEKAIAVAIAN